MALQIRRGTDLQRQSTLFAQGELVFTTDQQDLWIGTGSGDQQSNQVRIAPVKSVNELTGNVMLMTDDVPEGSTNKYYSADQAKIDVASALTAGNATNDGITFSYNSGTHTINASITTGGLLTAVSDDLEPQLGGSLTLNNNDVVGTGNIDITGNISATGMLTAGVFELDSGSISTSDNSYLKINSGISLGDTSHTGYLLITNNSTTSSAIDFQNHNNSADGGFVNFVRGRGTDGSPLRLQEGDAVYSLGFASNGSGTNDGIAYMLVTVDGATSAGIVPGKIGFAVADSTGTYIDAFDIKSTGRIHANYGISTGSSQDLGPGAAASLTKTTSYFYTDGGETATLAAGTEGQYKNFVAQDLTAGAMVITVANAGWKSSGSGTITMGVTGNGCQLQYVNGKWYCIGNNGAAFA